MYFVRILEKINHIITALYLVCMNHDDIMTQNIFHITNPLYSEWTGYQWILNTKGQ